VGQRGGFQRAALLIRKGFRPVLDEAGRAPLKGRSPFRRIMPSVRLNPWG